MVHHNPLSWVPASLDDIPLDYTYPVKSVIKYRSLADMLPFNNWLDYPVTAVFTCRGCSLNCRSCGGSHFAFKEMCRRESVAYRSPRLIAQDIHSIQRYLSGPVFIIGDIRQAGEDYADELLSEIKEIGTSGPIVLELFGAAGNDFFRKVKESIPHYNIQISPESHDEEIRRAFGKGWYNRDIEATIRAAQDNGCRRFDLFYMIGLPRQDRRSVMETVEYSHGLLREFGSAMLHPHISPLAPFIDPGSQVFQRPEDYGYRLFCRTLEQHRQALLSPTWGRMLSYETRWLDRQGIVDSTYEATLALNQVKKATGIIDTRTAAQVEARIRRDMKLVAELDQRLQGPDESPESREKELAVAATILKQELQWPARSFFRSMPRILWSLCRV